MSLSASSEERVERAKRRVDELPDWHLPHPDRHPKRRDGREMKRDWPRRHRDNKGLSGLGGLDERYALCLPKRYTRAWAKLTII